MKQLFLLFSLSIILSCKVQEYVIAPQSLIENEELDTLFVVAEKINTINHAASNKYRTSDTRKVDLLHTKLDVRLDWKNRKVMANATLDLRAYFYPVNSVELDAVNFDIKSVGLLGDNGISELSYNYDDSKLLVQLDKYYHQEETFSLSIDYVASPEKGAVQQSLAIGSDQGLFFIDPDQNDPFSPTQVWTQGETKYNSRWFPTIDSPNERCTQELLITVDEKYTTLSNGILVESRSNEKGMRTDHWKMDLPHAPYLFSLVVGEYAVVKEKWRDLELAYYVYPSFKEDAREIFRHTPEMLDFFSEITGVDYPWSKYSQIIVSDFVSGAMENTTAVTFAENFQKSREELRDYPNDMIVAHEMFHHWFGNLLTCESWAHTALNEGFANYAEYLWQEHKNGIEAAEFYKNQEMQQYLNSSDYGTHPLIDYEYDNRDAMFDAHSYNKGGLILHMLRKYVGDRAFFDALQKYLKDGAFSSVEAHDLRLAFEAVSGEDLNWFFDQWFFDKGHPVLDISYEVDQETQTISIDIDQIQEATDHREVFIFPLEYQMIFSENSSRKETLWVQKRENHFELKLDTLPEFILFNSNQDILCEISSNNTPQQYASMYKNNVHVVFRNEAIRVLLSKPGFEDFALLALGDNFAPIRRVSMDSFRKPLPGETLNILESMLLEDPAALNRAMALRTLIRVKADISKNQIIKLLKTEKSANVISICLDWLHKMAPESSLEYALNWTGSQAYRIEEIVGEILSESKDPVHLNYFESRIFSKGVFKLVPLIQAYSHLLGEQKSKLIYERCIWLFENIKGHKLHPYKRNLFSNHFNQQLRILQKRLAQVQGVDSKKAHEINKYIQDLEDIRL